MVNELSYNTISLVIDSWELLKRTEKYEEVAGVILFQHLFTESPPTKELFGFPITIDPSSKDLLNSRRFKMHSAYMIQMLDTALGMLGPDIELLSDILLELGSKHERYGVKPEMFMVMGKSLNHALSKVLGKSFDTATQEAWKETYAELSNDMIRAQKKRS